MVKKRTGGEVSYSLVRKHLGEKILPSLEIIFANPGFSN
jgi:hypothetical protein